MPRQRKKANSASDSNNQDIDQEADHRLEVVQPQPAAQQIFINIKGRQQRRQKKDSRLDVSLLRVEF
jgi:hypothetical protein